MLLVHNGAVTGGRCHSRRRLSLSGTPLERRQRKRPPSPENLANANAFALRIQRRKRFHNADEIMAEIVARRLVEHLERAGFVVMKKLPMLAAQRSGRGSSASNRPLPRPNRVNVGDGMLPDRVGERSPTNSVNLVALVDELARGINRELMVFISGEALLFPVQELDIPSPRTRMSGL